MTSDPNIPTRPTCDDRRLRQAVHVLNSKRISVLSLDIFDTVLWRIVPEPVDAFLLLGEKLRCDGLLESRVEPEVFAQLREFAERRARRRVAALSGGEEVTLEAVYAEMPAHIFRGAVPSDLPEVEVALETEITFPDLEILGLARMAQRDSGVRIVLVSDTYFSEKQLRRMLDRRPFDEIEIDRIFTSSEQKVGKGNGLFSRVLDDLGRAPEQVLHVGDHPVSDVSAPDALGIQTVHFDRFAPPAIEVLQREGVLRSSRGVARILLDRRAGDSGLTAVRSKALHRADHDRVAVAARGYLDFGTAVFGPVCTAFAEWVHEEAAARGFSAVHCLMREGEFLSRLLDGTRLYTDSPVVSRKLWASRQVTARAAIFEASEDELRSFLQRRRPPAVRQFLDGLGVGLAAFPELFTSADARLDDPRLLERVLELIARRTDVRAAITATAAELRRRLVAYVTRELADGDRLLVTDLGWGATIQANLQRVLDGSGVDIEVQGLYLATNIAAVDRILAGVRADGFLTNAGVPAMDSALLSRSPEVLEQSFMHDVGSLQGFTAEGEPIPGAANEDPVQALQRAAVQAGIITFQDEWARYRTVVPKSLSLTRGSVREQLLRSLRRFLVHPTQDEALMFSQWLHDDNFGSSESEQMVTGDLGRLVKYMTPEQYLELPSTKTYWPFGLAAMFEPRMATAIGAIVEEVVPREAFVLSEQQYMPLFFDDGSGFVEVARTPVRVNNAGLCFAREVLDARAVHGVRIAFPGGPGVVRADWLGLTFHLRSSEEPTRVVVEWPDEFEQLAHDHCVRLTPNVLVGHEQAPQLVYTSALGWRDDVYRVEVEAAFAWLSTASLSRPTVTDGLSRELRRVGRHARRLMRPGG